MGPPARRRLRVRLHPLESLPQGKSLVKPTFHHADEDPEAMVGADRAGVGGLQAGLRIEGVLT